MKTTPLFALVLALIPLTGFAAFAPAPREDAAALMAEIKKKADEIDPAKVTELGNLRTREAMQGLLECYDKVFGSIYMKREVVKALGLFDGVAEAEQPAMQKVADVATGSKEPELRAMALDVLGQSSSLGKHFLKTVIESNADSEVRETAMQKLVRMTDASDKDFFERLFKAVYAEKDKEKEKKSKKDAAPEQKLTSLKSIREMAFEQLAQDEKLFDNARLAELAREKVATDLTVDREQRSGIRRLALLELERRGDKKLNDLAKEIYKDKAERSGIRIEAARILMETGKSSEMLALFLEDGRANGASMSQVGPGQEDYESLRMALADLVAKNRDEGTTKELVKSIGKGKPYEQRFVLRALQGHRDEKLSKALAKQIVEAVKKTPAKLDSDDYLKSRNITLTIIETLGSMGEKGVLAELQGVIDAGEEAKANTDPIVIAGVMDAIGVLRGKDGAWLEALAKYAKSAKLDVRNAALMQLGHSGEAKYSPVLVAALEDADWSTRFAALVGLESLRTNEAIGVIVKRIGSEEGLMLHRFAETLFRLTGKPFHLSVPAWKTWWEKEGAGFQPISLAELQKLQADEELRRLREVSSTVAAKFFGMRIVSRRVIFVIDTSGSMAWDLHSEQAPPEKEKERSRMEIAKRELLTCIEALDPKALFNIITFDSDVDRWLDTGIVEFNQHNAGECKEWIGKLAPNGATNIYGALKNAFADPDVDTIYFLSDGEPSVEPADQGVIREHAREWNEHRKIVINTISVGGTFDILEWLALDSGGTNKKYQ